MFLTSNKPVQVGGCGVVERYLDRTLNGANPPHEWFSMEKGRSKSLTSLKLYYLSRRPRTRTNINLRKIPYFHQPLFAGTSNGAIVFDVAAKQLNPPTHPRYSQSLVLSPRRHGTGQSLPSLTHREISCGASICPTSPGWVILVMHPGVPGGWGQSMTVAVKAGGDIPPEDFQPSLQNGSARLRRQTLLEV